MNTTGNNLRAAVWRRATQLLAALFLLYAFADVSVLQMYSGNETIGVPSYALELQINRQKISRHENTDLVIRAEAAAADTSGSSREEQIPDPHAFEESCFGCCSHILLSFNLNQSIFREILPAAAPASNFSDHRSLYSASHLRRLYQPPKFA